MAALRSAFTKSGLSGQFSERFLCKYTYFGFYRTEKRLIFSLASQRLPYFIQNLSCLRWFSSAPQSLDKKFKTPAQDLTVRYYNVRGIHTTLSSEEISPEFASERVLVPNEYINNLDSFDEILKMVKTNTGVLVKAVKSDKDISDEKIRQWSVLIGGSRQDVQKAVSFLKSLLTPEPQKHSLVKRARQTDKTKERHFGDKEKLIWAYYRRNFKGQKPPVRTRKRCIRGKGEKQTVSGNPCPLCRLYLGGGYELDYKDVDLLSQFISPHNGEVFEASKTGLCRVQQERLVEAIQTAKDYGLLPYSIPGPRSLQKPPQVAQIPRNVRLK